MSDDLAETGPTREPVLASVQARLQHWSERAHTGGWIAFSLHEVLSDSVQARPADLFDSAERPLVIGLFGGTGVGKSSLLNRLAGDDIARTGVERPTSQEITVYVHESVTVSRLPHEFPLARLRTAIHRNRRFHNVMWVDMPDVDSVEARHRTLVQAWLPYLDVVVYMVSPERYRDDIGWRMLLEEGERHAWLFAMTHWDRADTLQYEDFRTLLSHAGLPGAPLYRLDNTGQSDDDFDTLAAQVDALSATQTLRALEQAGIGQRLRELHAKALQARQALPASTPGSADGMAGAPTDALDLALAWQHHWQQERPAWQERLDLRARALARQTASAPAGPWQGAARRGILPTLFGWARTPLTSLPGASGSPPVQPDRSSPHEAGDDHHRASAGLPVALIDAGLAARLQDSTERFLQEANGHAWPLPALRRHQPEADEYRRGWYEALNTAWEASVARPGTGWQRALLRALGWLSTLLPLAALGWAGWYVIVGYWRSGLDGQAGGSTSGPLTSSAGTSSAGGWLGTDFAIHSLLLLALAWAVPRFLQHLVRPTAEQIARQGLQAGAHAVLRAHETLVSAACQSASDELRSVLTELESVFEPTFGQGLDQNGCNDRPPLIQQLLKQPAADQPRTGVRATTHKSTERAP